MKDTLAGKCEEVERQLERIHDKDIPVLSYNDENSLACCIRLAYYSAVSKYIIIPEFPSGKGFADVVFVPRNGSGVPAMVFELKYEKSTEAAISQIKQRNYPQRLEDFTGDILLVGINYDKRTKKHICEIEHWNKS